MGATVDDVSLKISAESQSAISSLEKLATTLGNIATRISTISSTPLKINFTVTGGAEKEVNRLEQYVNKSAKTMSKNLQNAFNISPNNMAGVREAVNDLTKSIAATGSADMENLINEILNVGRAAREADETTKQFYSTFNSMSKIAINSADMTTDAWKNMNGAIRRVFTSDLSSGAMTLDQWIQSLNTDLRVFLQQFGDISASGNQFQTLSEAIKYCQEQLNMPLKNDSIDNQVLAMERLESETQKVVTDINNVKTALEATGATTETQNTGFSSITSVLTKLSKIDTGALTKVGTACESISAGVQSLNGVHVDVNSLEQIGNLTEKLKKIPTVNTDNIKNIGDALNTLSTSINSVSSIGSVDKSITNLVNALRRLASVDMTNFSASGLSGITEMVTKLAAVPDISNNVNRLVSSLAKLAGTGSSITTVSQTLPALGDALSQLITKISALGTIDASISSFTSAIAQLASSGAKATQAAANLRELGNALYEVMVQMSKAPEISSSVVQLTSAMSQLGRQHITVGSGFTSMNSSATKSISIFGKLKNSISGLMSKAMSLYYSLYMIKRVLSGLWSAVEKSMDYIETYNYYSVALGKVTEENAQYFAEYGYEDAETYANSFSERLEELTTKMTGYTLGDNGELISSGSIGLGLNPNDLLNYQANIMSITNSVGMMGETSEIASEALSMLASDLSSLKNIDVDTVMDNLTSGLVGQSRVMYQYGIDITNATLQEYAYEYGLSKSVSTMTQSEKMQLRLIAILDQSRVAWGDQANTVNSVANQYRIFKQQVSNLARTFGNLFIPILQAVLPYINAITKALTNLFNKLGKFIYGDSWEASLMDGISGSSSSAADYMDDLEDSTSDLADDYDDATDAAKEYENTVLGIDQLHKLNSENDSSTSSSSSSGDDSSSGTVDLTPALADLLAEYQSAWDSALADMNSKVDEFYARLTESAYSAGEFLGESIYNALESIDWNHIYEGARSFGTGLADFLNGLISPELFYSVGKTIANSLNTAIYASLSFATTFDWKDFGLSIASGINGFFQNFDFGSLANSIDAWVQGIWTMIRTAIGNISWKDIWKGITDFIGELDIETVGIIIGMVAIKKILGMKLLSKAMSSITSLLTSKISALLASKGITLSSVTMTIAGLALTIGGVVISASALKEMWNNGFSLGDEVKLGIGAALAGVGAVILAPFTGGASIALFTGIAAGIFGGGNLAILIKNNLDEIVQFFKDLPGNIIDAIKGLPEKIGEVIDAVLQWFSDLPAQIGYALGYAVGTVVSWAKDMIKTVKEKVPEIIDTVVTFFKELPGKVWTWLSEVPGKIVDWASDMIQTVKEKVPEIIESIKEFFQELPEDFIQFGKDIINGLFEGINSFVKNIGEKWSEFIDGFKKGFKDALGIHSPSTVFEGFGENCTTGLANGMTNTNSNNIISGAISTVKGWLSDLSGNNSESSTTTTVNVKLQKSGWTDLASYVGTASVVVAVALKKSGWTTLKTFIGATETITLGIALNSKNLKIVKSELKSIQSASVSVDVDISSLKETLKKVNSTVKSSLSGIPSQFKTTFNSAYKNMTSAFSSTKTYFTTQNNNVKSPFNSTASWFKTTFTTAYNNMKSPFSNTKTYFTARVNEVKTVFDKVPTYIKSAFNTAYNAIKNIFGGLGTYFKNLCNTSFKPFKTMVNGVISGVNWVLSKLGSKTKLSSWSGVTFAQGSEGVPQDTMGMVNDQKGATYREMIIPPNGKPFIPEGRNVVLPLTKGTKIMTADETKTFLKMPHFANGIGSLFGKTWARASSYSGDIWDYISNPKKIAQIALDKKTDVSNMVSPWTDIAKASVNKMMSTITDYISDAFDSAVPSVTYNPSAGVSQWSNLAKYALQLCGQYTSANLSRLLYQMQTESGGNPNAINLWDSNAKKGTPSKGLMQVIDPTFKAYAMKGYNTNIYDPLSNMLAAIRYTVARYGSLAKGWQGHGYASGIGKISLADLVPQFTLGGIVEDGLFQANQNEIIGRFGNGKTAVANNDQIASGIAEAVQPAVYNAMMAANAANKGRNIELVIELDGEEIGRTAVNYQKLQNKRYTVEPSFV